MAVFQLGFQFYATDLQPFERLKIIQQNLVSGNNNLPYFLC